MANIACYASDGNILDHYTQWDTNQKLIIRGADESSAPQFHFSNSFIKKAIITSSIVRTDGIWVAVPDILLRYSAPIIIHMCYSNNNLNTTKYSFRIPVMPRKEPEGYLYNDGDGGIVIDSENIVVNDVAPTSRSVLWFDTSAVD